MTVCLEVKRLSMEANRKGSGGKWLGATPVDPDEVYNYIKKLARELELENSIRL